MSAPSAKKSAFAATPTEKYYWDRIEFEFRDHISDLRTGKFEPSPDEESARNRRRIRAGSNRFGGNGILFEQSPTIDREEQLDYHRSALAIGKKIETLLARKKTSAELIHAWGAFNFSYALATHSMYMGRPEARLNKSGAKTAKIKSGAVDIQRRWLIRELKSELARSNDMTKAFRTVHSGLRRASVEKNAPAQLEKLFGSNGRFRSEYRAIKRAEIEKSSFENSGLPPRLSELLAQP